MLALLLKPVKRLSMEHPLDKLMLTVMWVLNAGLWINNFSLGLKIIYGIIAGIATVLGAINQWNTFKKTYKTMWVVVYVEKIFSKKKNRHRKRNPIKPKDIE